MSKNSCRKIFFCIGCVFLSALSCRFTPANSYSGPDSLTISGDSLDPFLKDTSNLILPVLLEEEQKKLKNIQKNVSRINSIRQWSAFYSKELEMSAEGGDATYYIKDGVLEKIIVNIFGETFQSYGEYYLLNDQLSFVAEKHYAYNRPMYYDSTTMRENNDSAVFDFKKSTITLKNVYFRNGKSVYFSTNEVVDPAIIPSSYKEEYERIANQFSAIYKLRN